jgi:hypothetical protein
VDRRNFFKFLAVTPVAVTLPKSEAQPMSFVGANWIDESWGPFNWKALPIDESMGVVMPSVPIQGFVVHGQKR